MTAASEIATMTGTVGNPVVDVEPGDVRLARSRHRPARRVQPGRRARRHRRARGHPGRRAGRRAVRAGAAGPGAGRARAAAGLGVHRPGRGEPHRCWARATNCWTSPTLPWPEPAQWLAACRAGPLVADGADAPGGRPLRLVDERLYLERYWREEESVRCSLAERAAAPPPVVDLARLRVGLDRLFGAPEAAAQRLAAAVGVLRSVSVLAGGPGTGKTSTVAGLLALLFDQPGPPPRVALAAPTGKAAARLEEAVAATLPARLRERVAPASTLHRLLGHRGGGGGHPAAALRRRGGRRDLDGVADHDGPAAGRGPAARPPGPGRRPGSAGLGGGRRGAR